MTGARKPSIGLEGQCATLQAARGQRDVTGNADIPTGAPESGLGTDVLCNGLPVDLRPDTQHIQRIASVGRIIRVCYRGKRTAVDSNVRIGGKKAHIVIRKPR